MTDVTSSRALSRFTFHVCRFPIADSLSARHLKINMQQALLIVVFILILSRLVNQFTIYLPDVITMNALVFLRVLVFLLYNNG